MHKISKAEEEMCRYLRRVLTESPLLAAIDDSPDLRRVFVGLEYFLSEILREVHSEWKGEGLDGIYPAMTRKTGEGEIEIIGVCVLISDQTQTPLHLQMKLEPSLNAVSWIECRLGEAIDGKMRREPYSQGSVNNNRLHVLKWLDSIDWVYHVGFGNRES